MEQKYYKVSDVARIFGLKPQIVRNYCHAKGQRFAFQPSGKGGCILVDIKKFEDFLKTRTA